MIKSIVQYVLYTLFILLLGAFVYQSFQYSLLKGTNKKLTQDNSQLKDNINKINDAIDLQKKSAEHWQQVANQLQITVDANTKKWDDSKKQYEDIIKGMKDRPLPTLPKECSELDDYVRGMINDSKK